VFSVGDGGGTVNIWDNSIEDPAPGPYRDGKVLYGFEFIGKGRFAFLKNRYRGVLNTLFWGFFDSDWFDWNDYSGLRIVRPDIAIGQAGVADRSLDWWKQQGFDAHSAPPQRGGTTTQAGQ
jgi:hypothetical protein